MIRHGWIDAGDTAAVVRQCVLAGVSPATVYAQGVGAIYRVGPVMFEPHRLMACGRNRVSISNFIGPTQ